MGLSNPTFWRSILSALLILSTLSLAATASAAPPTLENLGFEASEPGDVPSGWFVPTAARGAGYIATTVEESPRSGERCVLISHESEPSDDEAFGNLMRSFDATPYRGKRVRLSAGVRAEVEKTHQAQLWLRVDREDGQLGFFDNMYDRPIKSPQWRRYEIVGDVAEDATRVNFGLMLRHDGKAWLDDVEFEVLGEIGEGNEPPRPLLGRALDNLTAFARLLGYVRYFHPSDEAAGADWEALALAGVQTVENAGSSAELATMLERFFKPIAPTVQIFTGQPPPTLEPPDHTDDLELVAWHHRGVETGDAHPTYRSERVRSAGIEPMFVDLGGGVSALLPLALWTDENGTLPRGSADDAARPQKPPGFTASGNDRATRLAAVVLGWNVFQHFYPYFDVVETDWPEALRQALVAAAEDPDEAAFVETLQHLLAALHDGHAGAYHAASRPAGQLALRWEWIENRLVITEKGPVVTADVHPGDVVLEIDGRPVPEAMDEAMTRISGATPQWRRYRAVQDLLWADPGQKVELLVRSPGQESRRVEVEAPRRWSPFEPARPEKIAELEPGIFYVDLSRISDDDFRQALDRLATARGIVFDLRGYPRKVSTVVIAHLIDEPVSSAQWHVPVVTRPDREGMEFTFSNWQVTPLEPRLEAATAFLTDGQAISYAETYLGIIEHYELAEIVGSPTAGTNGNVNPFKLPGGYQVSFTGMKVLKHDGSRHHGVGIQPTVPVERTIRGVAAGRDEVLERAIQVVGGRAQEP